MRDVRAHGQHTREKGRERCRQSAQRMARVQHEVVPGERPRPPVVADRCRQDRLLERRCGAAVATHAIQHPDERERHECGGIGERRERQVADRAQYREGDEHSSSSPDIAAKTDNEGRDRRSGEANANEETNLRRGESQMRQMDRDRHANEADRRRPNEPGRVDEPCVTFPGRSCPGSHYHLTF